MHRHLRIQPVATKNQVLAHRQCQANASMSGTQHTHECKPSDATLIRSHKQLGRFSCYKSWAIVLALLQFGLPSPGPVLHVKRSGSAVYHDMMSFTSSASLSRCSIRSYTGKVHSWQLLVLVCCCCYCYFSVQSLLLLTCLCCSCVKLKTGLISPCTTRYPTRVCTTHRSSRKETLRCQL